MKNASTFVQVLLALGLFACAQKPTASSPNLEPYRKYILKSTQADPIKLDGKTYSLENHCDLLPEPQYGEQLVAELKSMLQKQGLVETQNLETAFLNIGVICGDNTDYYKRNPQKDSTLEMANGQKIASTYEVKSDGKKFVEIRSQFAGQITEEVKANLPNDKIIGLRFYAVAQPNKKYRKLLVDQNATFVPSKEFLSQSWKYLTADLAKSLDKIEYTTTLKELCVPRLGFEFTEDRNHIKKVLPKSPAQKAGLKKGDELVMIQSLPIQEFYAKLAAETFENQKTIPIEIRRNGKIMIKEITPKLMCSKL